MDLCPCGIPDYGSSTKRERAGRAALYPSEWGLSLLRTVLVLLSLGDVPTAGALAAAEVERDEEAADNALWAASAGTWRFQERIESG